MEWVIVDPILNRVIHRFYWDSDAEDLPAQYQLKDTVIVPWDSEIHPPEGLDIPIGLCAGGRTAAMKDWISKGYQLPSSGVRKWSELLHIAQHTEASDGDST